MRLARERGSTMGVRKWLESLTVVLRGVADPFPASGGLRQPRLPVPAAFHGQGVADPFPASGGLRPGFQHHRATKPHLTSQTPSPHQGD